MTTILLVAAALAADPTPSEGPDAPAWSRIPAPGAASLPGHLVLRFDDDGGRPEKPGPTTLNVSSIPTGRTVEGAIRLAPGVVTGPRGELLSIQGMPASHAALYVDGVYVDRGLRRGR